MLVPVIAPSALLTRVVKCAPRLEYFITKYQPCFLLAGCSILAYMACRVDYDAKGSGLLRLVLHDLQVQVFRRILALQAYMPLDLSRSPVVFGGWGCPQVATRAATNFVEGYLLAFDSHSLLTQAALRGQSHCPLHSRHRDYEQFRACCEQLGVVVRAVSELAHDTHLLQLRESLLLEEVTYGTTNASKDVPEGLLQPENTRVGIVISDGVESKEFSLGVVAMAAMSSAMEWLAKLFAV